MDDVIDRQDVAFLSNPDTWTSDKIRTLVDHVANGRSFDPAEFELLAQQVYDLEARWINYGFSIKPIRA